MIVFAVCFLLGIIIAQSHAGGWFATDGAAAKKTKRQTAKAGHSLTAARAVAQQSSGKPKPGGLKGAAPKQHTEKSNVGGGGKSAKPDKSGRVNGNAGADADIDGGEDEEDDDDQFLHASPADAALAYFAAHGCFELRPSRAAGVRHAESARAVTHVRVLAASVVALR
jgi:hypothetical protein